MTALVADRLAPEGNAVRRFLFEPAGADADAVAITEATSGLETTRGQLADRARRAGAALAALGVQPEQRVVMVMADRVEFLEVFWGAISIGAVPVPVSSMLGTHDYEFLLRDSRAAALVVSDVFVGNVLPATRGQMSLRHVIVEGGRAIDEGDTRVEHYREIRDAAGPCGIYPADGEDIAYWLYTSGTTGFPKGTPHRHADMSFLTDRFAREVMNVTEADRMYAVPKLFFAYGLGVSHFALGCGASQVLFDGRPTVETVVEHVTRYQPTLFWGVPTFLAQLLSSNTPADAFASVRAAVTGGETLPDDIRRRCLDRFGFAALDAIGSTEVGHIYICNRLDRQHAASVGWPVPGFEVELRDVDGNSVPDGAHGQLFVAGESLTPGYWRRTARNREAFHRGFFDTGDTFVRNDDGSYTYLGRGDDMIKAGGIWVSPTEVEAAIVELPEVSMAAVVGVPDADGLEKPKAFVVLEAHHQPSDALVERIQQHVKTRLAPFKYPRWVEFRTELPVTATGKLRRHVLRSDDVGGG